MQTENGVNASQLGDWATAVLKGLLEFKEEKKDLVTGVELLKKISPPARRGILSDIAWVALALRHLRDLGLVERVETFRQVDVQTRHHSVAWRVPIDIDFNE